MNLRDLMRGDRALDCDPCCIAHMLASGIPSNGMFLDVLSAPTLLGDFLQRAPTQFFWLFSRTIGVVMAGAASWS